NRDHSGMLAHRRNGGRHRQSFGKTPIAKWTFDRGRLPTFGPPVPTRNPEEYSFNFTPSKPGNYGVWADVRPYPLGLQEYAMTDIRAATTGEPLTNRTVIFKATVDGLNYELILAQKTIQVGRPASARLRITTADGNGFTQLEPLMATFAHLVGFNQDYKTVIHMHPKGAPVLDPAARWTGTGVSDLCAAARLRSS